jgi:hypothetical protein
MVAIVSGGTSQTLNDSTLLPNDKLRLAINKIEAGKISYEQIASLNEKVGLLQHQIAVKDSLMVDYRKTIDDLKKVNEKSNRIINEGDRILNTHIKLIELMQKKIRTQSWMKWVFLGVGVAFGRLIK